MKSQVLLSRGRLPVGLAMVGLLVGLLAGALPLSAQTLPPGGTFVDDDGSLHEPDIEAIAAADITQGCSSNQFCPGQSVSRGEMAAFLTRAMDLSASDESPFTDASGQFEDEINSLSASGITTGCSATLFCPAQSVSRGQMAAFLTRALDLPASSNSPFSDSSGQFQNEINSLAASGITSGCGAGRFCPNDPVTRAQMASFLTRGLGLTPITPPPRTQPGTGTSYVNPPNTGNKIPVGQLQVVNGDLSISTDQHIENMLIHGRLIVRNGAEVTAQNITVLPETDSNTPAVYVSGSGTRLTISHFTVSHGPAAWSLRVIGVDGGWVSASFGDLSGAEDGINVRSSHGVGQLVFADSWIHDLKGSPPGGINPAAPHFDGIQVMAGNVLIERSVFQDIEPSTAAIFPKSDFGDVTLTIRNTYASGGGYTIYRGDECCGYQVVSLFENVEANPYPISNCGSCGGPGSRWGAVHEVTGGATSSGTIEIVDWNPGEPGFHPGSQT